MLGWTKHFTLGTMCAVCPGTPCWIPPACLRKIITFLSPHPSIPLLSCSSAFLRDLTVSAQLMCGGEASPASALHGPGKPKCSQLLKGPFNPLPASTPPLDLPGMQDTGTFITPLQALKGTDHFCACSTPHGEPPAPLGHQAYVPLATHTPPWHQHSQRPALAPKSQAVGKARKNAVLSGIRAGFWFLAPFGGLRGTLHKVLAG